MSLPIYGIGIGKVLYTQQSCLVNRANSNVVQVWLFLGTFLYIVILIGCSVDVYLKEVDINTQYMKQVELP